MHKRKKTMHATYEFLTGTNSLLSPTTPHPATLTSVQTLAYATPGDNGGALYKRITFPPSTPWQYTASDGSRWELDVPSACPEMFGGNNSGLDITAEIQKALDYMAVCRAMHFLGRAYRVDGTLNVNHKGKITGAGRHATILQGAATNDVLQVVAGEVDVEGIRFAPRSARTAGAYFLAGASNVTLRNFEMSGAWVGIYSTSTVFTAQGGQIRDTARDGVSINISGGFDVSIRDIVMDAPANAQPFAGIAVFHAGDVTVEDCNLIHQGQDLYISPRTGQGVFSVYANNTFFDTANYGVVINPLGGGFVGRCMLSNCWMSSHSVDGIRIDADASSTVDGLSIQGCHVFLNANNGLTIPDGPAGTRVRNIDVRNSVFAGNAGSGIWVNNAMDGLRVVGNVLMAWGDFANNGNPMWFAAGSAGANRCLVTDNHSNTGLLVGPLGAQSRIADNVS